MKPVVSIIMGSTSDLPIMEKAAKVLDEFAIPFEMHALSAHRTPDEVADFAQNAADRGIKVIIAAAGMAAHLAGVIASMTTLPVIGVPIKSSVEGMDALLAMVQMPPGIPVATVAINGSVNAAVLAAQIMAVKSKALQIKLKEYKLELEEKVEKKVFYIKSLQVDIEMLASAERDADTKAALTKLAEKIRFSDPMSSEVLAELEAEITAKVKELKTAENKAAIITVLDLLLTERNKKAKLLK